MDILPVRFNKVPGSSGIINKPKHSISSVQKLYKINSINPIIVANMIPNSKINFFEFFILQHLTD